MNTRRAPAGRRSLKGAASYFPNAVNLESRMRDETASGELIQQLR
jgi:hypothetical protein